MNTENKFLTYEDIKKRIKEYNTHQDHYSTTYYYTGIKPIKSIDNLKQMNQLKYKLLNIQYKDVLLFFNDFFNLFKKSIYSYNLLLVLSIIYEDPLVNLHMGCGGAAPSGVKSVGGIIVSDYSISSVRRELSCVDMRLEHKLEYLEQSFNIFKRLNNREIVLSSIVTNNLNRLPEYLLGDYQLLKYLERHPNLFNIKEYNSILDNMFPQLKDNQR